MTLPINDLSYICQHFSCWLDEETANISKIFDSNYGFWKADHEMARNCCPMGWIGCPTLQYFNFLQIVVKFWKFFLCYSITQKTYRGILLQHLGLRYQAKITYVFGTKQAFLCALIKAYLISRALLSYYLPRLYQIK